MFFEQDLTPEIVKTKTLTPSRIYRLDLFFLSFKNTLDKLKLVAILNCYA